MSRSTGHLRPAAAGSGGRLKIVVAGYIVRGPIGGMAWHHLNYVKGLTALGHDVLFIEDSDDYASCYDPTRHSVDTDPSYGLRFADHAFRLLGLEDCWCFYDAHRSTWHGPAASRALEHCRDAELFLNISAVNPLRDWTMRIPLRAYVDTDPLFTQARHLEEPTRLDFARAHNAFLTFGEAIPAGRSQVPDDGLPWQPTRQPVALDAWPVREPAPGGAFTTVMHWDSYPTRRVDGREYGMKSASFRGYEELPHRTDARLALALGGDHAPRERLAAFGWRIDDPVAATRDIRSYQEYIAAAKGEWSVAKHGYVAAATGWFSERSACFLASGRPVIVQDTGCHGLRETDGGLFFFSSAAEALEAIREVETDYRHHCAAARKLAESRFAAGPILTDLIERCASPSTREVAA